MRNWRSSKPATGSTGVRRLPCLNQNARRAWPRCHTQPKRSPPTDSCNALSAPRHEQQPGFVVSHGVRQLLLDSFNGCNRGGPVRVALGASCVKRVRGTRAKLPCPWSARRILGKNKFHFIPLETAKMTFGKAVAYVRSTLREDPAMRGHYFPSSSASAPVADPRASCFHSRLSFRAAAEFRLQPHRPDGASRVDTSQCQERPDAARGLGAHQERTQPHAVLYKPSGRDSALDGVEFVMVALASCCCNHLYCEAERLDVPSKGSWWRPRQIFRALVWRPPISSTSSPPSTGDVADRATNRCGC